MTTPIAIVHRVIHQLAVKRRLQNAGGEIDIVHRRPVIGIHRRGSFPIPCDRWLIDLLILPVHFERARAQRIAGIVVDLISTLL